MGQNLATPRQMSALNVETSSKRWRHSHPVRQNPHLAVMAPRHANRQQSSPNQTRPCGPVHFVVTALGPGPSAEMVDRSARMIRNAESGTARPAPPQYPQRDRIVN
jgi:hypothetical protein